MPEDFNYPVTLTKQKEGGYLVQFPDFPEAITQGDSEEEALQAAADCLEEAVANRITMGLDIPPKTNNESYPYIISLHVTLAAKCALYVAMKKNKCKNVLLAKNLKCDEKEVRRLLDPKYRSKISRIEEALNFLGKKLTLTVTTAEHLGPGFHVDGFPSKKPQKTDHHQSATR